MLSISIRKMFFPMRLYYFLEEHFPDAIIPWKAPTATEICMYSVAHEPRESSESQQGSNNVKVLDFMTMCLDIYPRLRRRVTIHILRRAPARCTDSECQFGRPGQPPPEPPLPWVACSICGERPTLHHPPCCPRRHAEAWMFQHAYYIQLSRRPLFMVVFEGGVNVQSYNELIQYCLPNFLSRTYMLNSSTVMDA